MTPDRIKGNPAKALNYVEGKPKYYGRWNAGVSTVNLLDVALSSGGDFDKFWELLEERCNLCRKANTVRIKRLENTKSDVAPILWQHGAYARLEKGECIKPLIHGGYATCSLGYASLSECVRYMTGYSHSHKPEGHDFGVAVMERLNEICAKWKEEDDIDWSLYGSPIESCTYKFAKALKERFGEIKGLTDKNYVTNSCHLDVTEKINAFDKLTIESEFQKLSPGGNVNYVESSNLQDNIPAVLAVIKHIYDTNMYAEINCKSDYCQECGYDGELLIDDNMEWYCPNCGNRDQSKMNCSRRTCGKQAPIIATHQNNRNSGEVHTSLSETDNPEPSLSTKACCICGRIKSKLRKTHGKYYCEKHYNQLRKYGKCLDSNPRTHLDPNEIVVKGDFAVIYLYNRSGEKIAETKIDIEDIEKVKHIKWRLSHGYVNNSNKKNGPTIHLHRFVLNTDQFVDHINHDTLDNRKQNLRIVTKSQNAMNTNFKGVSLTPAGKFYAHIKYHQKMINLGVYIDEAEAYYARWYAEKVLFKEYRFPKEKPFILPKREEEIESYVDKKVQRL